MSNIEGVDHSDDGRGIPKFLSLKDNPRKPPELGPPKKVSTAMVRAVEENEAEAAEATPAPDKAKAKNKAKAAKPAKNKPAAKPAKAKAIAKAKPARESTAKKDAFGLRDGSNKSIAASMYASKKGATLGEVKAKVGSVQLNVLTELKEAGYKVKQVKEAGKGKRQIARYFLSAK